MIGKCVFKNDGSRRVAVIGEGAAGMMSAVFAAKNGADVVIFEKNDRPGRKLRITGKGRCNVTNDSSTDELMANIPTNSRFLYAAFNRFSTADTMSFFENCGVPLKVERGKRVFPVSDKASDIVKALVHADHESGVTVCRERVLSLIVDRGRVVGVRTICGEYMCDAVIVCTGGMSYPMTGSDGDGYKLAKSVGHTIVPPRPSLVPMVCGGVICPSMQGLSLKNIKFKIYNSEKTKPIYEDFGELVFTHFGLSGPVVLSASSYMPEPVDGRFQASIDFKPALDSETLDKRILSDFHKYINRDFINSLSDLLPQKAILPIIKASGIDVHKKVNSITKEERTSLVRIIKDLRIPICGFRPIDEAIITKGGVAVNEINPGSMESKLVGGLYFAGEVIDVDAYTGGFNLQIAFSTAVLAGENAAWGT